MQRSGGGANLPPAVPLPWSEIFPDEDYRFHLRLRPGDVRSFFAPTDAALLAERAGWLDAAPALYAGATATAAPLLDDMERELEAPRLAAEASPFERVVALGLHLEPDWMLIDDDLRLAAGAVCFPTAWALTEKLGRPLAEIHAPVPALNAAIGAGIERFFAKLKPGAAFERANWGLAASPELNLHPALNRPRLVAGLDLHAIRVRVEDQLFVRLPTAGILFGIRLRVLPLVDLLGDPVVCAGLRRALVTMPDPIAGYKAIDAIRPGLLAHLDRR